MPDARKALHRILDAAIDPRLTEEQRAELLRHLEEHAEAVTGQGTPDIRAVASVMDRLEEFRASACSDLRSMILALVGREERTGYQLAGELRTRLGAGLGSLYPVLHRLEERGRIVSEWKTGADGKNPRYYRRVV